MKWRAIIELKQVSNTSARTLATWEIHMNRVDLHSSLILTLGLIVISLVFSLSSYVNLFWCWSLDCRSHTLALKSLEHLCKIERRTTKAHCNKKVDPVQMLMGAPQDMIQDKTIVLLRRRKWDVIKSTSLDMGFLLKTTSDRLMALIIDEFRIDAAILLGLETIRKRRKKN